MPSVLLALELRDEHLGLRVRTREAEGVLRAYSPVDDTHVQLLVEPPGMPPLLPVVPRGHPVELLD